MTSGEIVTRGLGFAPKYLITRGLDIGAESCHNLYVGVTERLTYLGIAERSDPGAVTTRNTFTGVERPCPH